MPVYMARVTFTIPVYVRHQGSASKTLIAAAERAAEIPSYQLSDLDCDPDVEISTEVETPAQIQRFGLEDACPYGSGLTVEEILAAERTLDAAGAKG